VSFLSKDKVENVLHLRVTEMDHNQLVKYFEGQQRITNGVNVVCNTAEHVIVKKYLLGTYQQPDAGRIMKWLFYRYKGKVTVKDEPEIATLRSFNAKMKWWVDKLNSEQQQAVRAEEAESALVGTGFTKRSMKL